MRFSDLNVGDRFFYEGLEYTKSSPVLASDANGHSRFIPRSAVLQTHPAQTPPIPRVKENELDRFYQATLAIVRQQVQDVDLATRLRQAIEKSWREIKQAQDDQAD